MYKYGRLVVGVLFFPFALFCWIISSFLVLIAYFIVFNAFQNEDKRYRVAFQVTQLWGRAVCSFLFCRVKVVGRERLDNTQGYILTSNHLSMVDIPLGMAYSPVPFSFLAKAETLKIPVIGYLVRNAHVAVDRKSEASRRKSAKDMAAHISKGRSIHIYPEGTRNKSDKPLTRFYDGAFKLAVESQTPLSVIVIKGTERVINPHEWFQIHPFETIEMHYLDILPPNSSPDVIKEQTEKIMLDCLAA